MESGKLKPYRLKFVRPRDDGDTVFYKIVYSTGESDDLRGEMENAALQLQTRLGGAWLCEGCEEVK